MALWGVSWGMSYVDLGAASLAIAFGIAALKAVLVVLFFMEIIHEKTSIHATVVTGLAMIVVMITFIVADIRTRDAPLLAPPPRPASVNQPALNPG
jgi:cytochrome c oxidase subunit 4